MPQRYYVKKDICIGCGVCPSVAPAVFVLADDGLAENFLPNEMVPDDLLTNAEEALESCPVDAIFKE
jgi:ferredoxin